MNRGASGHHGSFYDSGLAFISLSAGRSFPSPVSLCSLTIFSSPCPAALTVDTLSPGGYTRVQLSRKGWCDMSVKKANESLTQAENVLKRLKRDAQAVGSNLTATEVAMNEIISHLVDANVQTLNELQEVRKIAENAGKVGP